MSRIISVFLFCFIPLCLQAQYDWELEKDQHGIKVYSSHLPYGNFKAVKVECELNGDFEELMKVLTDVDGMKGWVYKTKNIKLLSAEDPSDISYYSETDLPWPVANRDAVINLEFNIDSLPEYITIKGTCDEYGVPKVDGLVRLSHFKADWKITKIENQSINVEYILEVDPGGDLPAWINNMFILKGPYETFYNLSEKLND
ncbi:MAG: hypothetical protein HKO56_04930 [Bacteroidia bacterium]|nr:hypothetical protein [Bacteroidia bacterium]NNM15982.1 hypothetical protein [Bacteroidia bacterium]